MNLIVTEGISGMWFYHLSRDNEFTRSLCGVQTMRTSIPLERWGRTPKGYHIHEKWCPRCHGARIAREQGVQP
jgi:hypothetical protein